MKGRIAHSIPVMLFAALAFAAFCGVAHPQDANGAGTAASPRAPQTTPEPTIAVNPGPPKASLAAFAWLAGTWQGAWGPRIAQQVWMPAKSGTMVGTFQLSEGGDTLVLELFALVEKGESIRMFLRHFTPALAPWEASGPTVLNLESLDAKTIVFKNPANGGPKRAIIRRIDAETYVSRSEIIPLNGEMQAVEITYHRQRPAAPSRH